MPRSEQGVPDPVADAERTRLMAPSAASVSAPLQTVSVEEMLDLEQQVEFLTVLGQEDAALGLLVEHLRKTGGTYPMPFLKLMEMHRRRGEREAYERVRARFNQRFNAVAAAFAAPPASPRYLADDPLLLQRIQQAWGRPVDAMTLLENLIFRAEGTEPLDMATLDEVVFLHALARDLNRHSAAPVGEVDVLLPLQESAGVIGEPSADEPASATDGARLDQRASDAKPRRAATGRLGMRGAVDVLLEDLHEAEGPHPPTAGVPVAPPTAGAPVAPPPAGAPAALLSAVAAAAPPVGGDAWPTIADADFDLGGIEMEPLDQPSASAGPGGAGGPKT